MVDSTKCICMEIGWNAHRKCNAISVSQHDDDHMNSHKTSLLSTFWFLMQTDLDFRSP